MAQSFTRNYRDHSNDNGYQFEFFCDKCGNGYRSSYKTSGIGMAGSILRAAGSIFGGVVNDAGYGVGHMKDALRGSAWDDAFAEAIQEIRPRFCQCMRCGIWVCPEICWNSQRTMCRNCAPDLGAEAAHIQANVAVEQLWTRAREHDQAPQVDMRAAVAHQGAPTSQACASCRAALPPGARFCAGCGTPVAAAAAKKFCIGCGGELIAGARFCAGCGTKAVE